MKINYALFAILICMTAFFANQTFVYSGHLNGSGGKGNLNFSFADPVAIDIGDDGVVYVGDLSLGGVYGLNSTDSVVITIGKRGGASDFSQISDVLYYDKHVYVADRGNRKIYKHVFGSGVFTVGPPRDLLKGPYSVWIENGTMWILNSESDRILEYNIDRNYLTNEYLSSGIGSGKLNGAQDFVFDDNYVYVADTKNNRVEIFDREFNFVRSIATGRGGITITGPKSIAVDSDGRIFVADWINDRIVVFDVNGNVLETFGETGKGEGKFNNPTRMAFSDNGTLYIVDRGNDQIVYYTFNWSANIASSVSEIERYNETVRKYKQDIIDVMDELGIERDTYASQTDMQKAYDLLGEEKYGEAKTAALRAVEKIEDRRLLDRQKLDVALNELYSNLSFGLKYYANEKLGLTEEKELVDMRAKYDSSHESFEKKEYAVATEQALEIQTWIGGMELATEQQKQTDKVQEDKGAVVEPDEKLMIDNRVANLKIELEKLQTRADKVGIYAGFDTVNTLNGISSELAKVGAYSEARDSLDNAEQKLGEIETKIANKEETIRQVQTEIDSVRLRIMDMGIDVEGQSAAAKELRAAQEIVVDDPQKALDKIDVALEYAQTEQLEQNKFGYAFAAVAGAFIVIAVIGTGAFFYIMQRNKKRTQGLGDVKIKFAKTEDEIKQSKKKKRRRR